jgi:hypothetical protein
MAAVDVFAAAAPGATVTVSNTTQMAITSAISSACNGRTSGIVLFPNGPYTVNTGVEVPDYCTLQAANQGQATLNVTTGSYGVYVNGDNVTITGLTFNGGGILTTNTSLSRSVSCLTITYNTFQNISGGNDAIDGNGVWYKATIAYNRISYISHTNWSSITSSTGDMATPGNGINNVNGIDESVIRYNSFDHIQGDGIHIAFNYIIGAASSYTTANNNDISYNTFSFMHRMGLEYQGTTNYPGGCPGGCTGFGANRINGATVKGNFYYLQYRPYYNSMAFSLVIDHSVNTSFYNNTGVADDFTACGGAPFGMEESGDGQVSQGNVFSAINACGAGQGWSSYFQTASIGSGYTVTLRNNFLCGPVRNNGGGTYFGHEGYNSFTMPGSGLGSAIEQYNYTSAACPNSAAPYTSTLAIAFASPDNQAIRSGGVGTWNVYATDEISVVNVQFALDGSTTPMVTQEVQDLNTNFTNDAKWLYHATIDTSQMNPGIHTISAVATDVSGAVQTVQQTFQLN